MKIALYIRQLDAALKPQLQQLVDTLHRHQVATDQVSDHLPDSHYDLLLSIGGDGTLLS